MPTKASSNAKSAPVPIPASKKLKQAKGGKVVLADINTILFRKNVLEMMQFTPEGRDEEITVHASIERLNLISGHQQSVQICSSKSGEQWVTRWSGERNCFPRSARVSKRARDEPAEEEEDDDAMEIMEKEGTMQTPTGQQPLHRKILSAPQAPVRRSARNLSPVTSRSAPRSVDTFQQHTRKKVTEAFDRGEKISNLVLGKMREQERMQVKEEENRDDLSSLCGKIFGLDVKSNIDTDSEYQMSNQPSTTIGSSSERRQPHASTSARPARNFTA